MVQKVSKPTSTAYASPYDPQMSIDGIVEFFRSTDLNATVDNGSGQIPVLARLVFDLQNQPGAAAWAHGANLAAALGATVAETVQDARPVVAGTLQHNDVVSGELNVYIPDAATAGNKNFRLCLDSDTGGSMLVTLGAQATGLLTVKTKLFVGPAAPHVQVTTVQLNDMLFAHFRGTVGTNLATTAMNLQARAWTDADADKALVVVDSVSWALH